MLLSKSPDRFLPGGWPPYYSSARGITVTDLDGRRFQDFSLMGVGTNILGYSHRYVNARVKRVIGRSVSSTLNCPEEVALGERLLELNPWAEMVRLARTGGEANAIALRIARVASGSSKVLVCGYHGWHDWYLAANISQSDALNGLLLPGLSPKGVPPSMSHEIETFEYGNLNKLKRLLRGSKVGVIFMEVSRAQEADVGFLKEVRRLARKFGCVLVFDECTSGFRAGPSGLHLEIGVEPDIATYGKALGNGFAITAVVGRRNVMEHAKGSFISSTFWSERVGPTAALATLTTMQRTNSAEKLVAGGHMPLRSVVPELVRVWGMSQPKTAVNSDA